MAEIPVFRIHSERIKKEKFEAIARYLGLRGKLVATEDALFMQDKQRALAYAMPGSRFAGLLFFTDQTQGVATPVRRVPVSGKVEEWTREFLKRFQLVPQESADDRIRLSFAVRVLRTDSVVESGVERKGMKRVPVKTDVISDLRVNGYYVTGPRAKLRLVFKAAMTPVWIHRGLWEKLEVFETRRMLTEDEAYRIVTDQLSRRGYRERTWRLVGSRLAYTAGEFSGGPDLLLPYYFTEIEMHDSKETKLARQGPRQLIQIPACC